MTHLGKPPTLFELIDSLSRQDSRLHACRMIFEAIGADPDHATLQAAGDIRLEEDWKRIALAERQGALRSFAASLISNPPEKTLEARAPRIYGRDGMIDANERRDFAEEVDAEEEARFQAFVATKTRMTVAEYFQRTGDNSTDLPPESHVLAYSDRYWIQVCDDGKYQLILGNRCWMTDNTTSIEDLERELFNYAKDDEDV